MYGSRSVVGREQQHVRTVQIGILVLTLAGCSEMARLPISAGTTLPAPFAQGMFIGQHGSWNRRPHSGYKVIFVPFEDGKPSGAPVDVLTGFLNAKGHALGRPVGVVLDKQGALLVADDVGILVMTWPFQTLSQYTVLYAPSSRLGVGVGVHLQQQGV